MSNKENVGVSIYFVDSMGSARHFLGGGLNGVPSEGEYIELYPPEVGFAATFYRVVRVCRHYHMVESGRDGNRREYTLNGISVYVRSDDPALDNFPR